MRIAYFDCFSGAAGDMIIGALLDSGLAFEKLNEEIEKLNLSGYKIAVNKVTKNHIAGTKFDVTLKGKQPYRKPGNIIEIINRSAMSEKAKRRSVEIFNRLALAEAAAHGESPDKVHFHEVGGVDAIIDICATVMALEILEIDRVHCSPLALGTGSVQTDHGIMPVPAPATAVLAKNIPVRFTEINSELTTPTGAAILTTIAQFSTPDHFRIESIGYGAGSRDFSGLPNLLRVMIGPTPEIHDSDNITMMETNLDRATPEMLGNLLDELLAAGALDVFITPVLMKKNRPGHLLTLLCDPAKKDQLSKIVFRRGLTLGIRITDQSRIKLRRREISVTTSGGDVSVKIGHAEDGDIIFPEFDDMSSAMKRSGKSYDDIYFEIKNMLRKER
jgi:uncharacterized protein (TIGR00299 family) protein